MSNIGLIIEERAANIGNFMAGHQQATPWHADMGSLAPGAGGDGALLHSHPYGGDAHLGEGGDSDEADCWRSIRAEITGTCTQPPLPD